VLVFGFVEIFSLVALYFGRLESPDSLLRNLCHNSPADSEIILPPWMAKNVGRTIIHPYQGFVYNPENLEITNFGFLDAKTPIQKKSEDKIIIGILGGSSAEIFGQFGSETLKNDLLKDAAFKGKEIIVLNLAIGSYKQPQQVMVLNYLLALGGEFDFLINLDGFNELVLPVVSNIPSKVNPFFPLRWDLKVIDTAILEPQIVVLADIFRLQQKKLKQANLAYCGILRFSLTFRLISYCLDRGLNLKIIAKRMELINLQNQQAQHVPSIVGHGPEFNYDNQSDLYEKLAALWARSSKQMSDLCQANRIQYFHFIQPCQYVPDSKSMEATELKAAFDQNALHRQVVIDGYPVLRKQAEWLNQQGIAVYDLSMVFKGHAEQLYIDTFCHFGAEGSKIIAAEIVQIIVTKHKKQ